MSQHLVAGILAVFSEGRDLALATTFADGRPHVVTVSYASEGLMIYFGCSAGSQKAQNLARDGRVALTITLPYRDWGEIRGVSLSGHARALSAGEARDRAAILFMQKFSEIAQYVSTPGDELSLFAVTPEVIGLLDYRKGFGHVEHVRVVQAEPPRIAPLSPRATRQPAGAA
jgi:nitroimidazol reductase NimA-like FMN-containing flavoprotein (pyridoxamine 5'-phosphate oxidase superfamily)